MTGRGTDTRVDSAGQVIKKPVMGTKDQPDIAILVTPAVMTPELTRADSWPQLRVELVDERPS